MKFSNLLIFSFIYCLITIFTGCSKTPTSIERVNPNDPESSDFDLENSQNMKTEILDNSTIRISWEDSVLYADYYILRKSLNSSTEFSIIDTIDIDTKEYFDSSGEITLETRYSISNQRQQKSGDVISSDTLFAEIDFGKLNASAVIPTNSDSSRVQFSWDFNNNWPFIGVVHYKNDENSAEVAIDTLYELDNYTTPKFEIDFKYRNYELKFYVSEIDLLNGDVYEKYSATYDGTSEYAPVITDVNIVNESEIIISWSDNSTFEEGFQVLRSQKNNNDISSYDVIATLANNETVFKDTLNPFNSYSVPDNQTEVKYGIRAFKGNSSSADIGTRAQIPTINPKMRLSGITGDSFELTWSSESDYVKQYILQLSTNGIDYVDFETFSKEVFSFTSSSTDYESSVLYFRIKTSTSKPSSSIGLSTTPELIEEASFAFEKSRHFRFSESGNLIAVSRGSPFNPLDLGVLIYNLNSNSIIYSKDLLNASIHGIDINESKKRIAVASSTKRSVAVYDYEADTLMYIKNNFSVYDVHFSPDANSIYTNSTRGNFSKHDLLTNNDVFTLSDGVATSQSNIRQLSVSPTGDSIAYNVNGFLNLSDSLGNLIGFNNPTNIDDISQDVRFSTKGTYLSLTNRTLGAYIYKAKTNSRYFEFDSRYVSINYNETLVFAGDAYELYLLDLENRKHISTYIFDELITNVAFSPKENIVAVGTSSGIKIYSLSNTNTLKELKGNFDLRYPNN